MIQAAAALALASALTSEAPTQLNGPTVDKMGEHAVYAFLSACVYPLMGAPSAEEYARNAHASAAQVLAGLPSDPVSLDGLNGKTCRIVYTGSDADRVFAALVSAVNHSTGCKTLSTANDNVTVTCAPTLLVDGYEATVTRTSPVGHVQVIGSVTVTSPGLSPTGQSLTNNR